MIRVSADPLNVRKVTADVDSTPTVGVFTWLHDPHLLSHLGVTLKVCIVFGRVESISKLVEFFAAHSFGDVGG